MWPDTDLIATRETGRAVDPQGANDVLRDFPGPEVVDYYIAKANTMRARSYRRALSRGWKAVTRFVNRQLSPCRRVKLPSSTG